MRPEQGENAAAGNLRREVSPEQWAEGTDSFLPWEAEVNARIRAQFAAEPPTAYEHESATLGSDPFLNETAPAFGPEEASPIPSDFRAADESVTVTEPSAYFSESPSYAAETTERDLPGEPTQPHLDTFGRPSSRHRAAREMPADCQCRGARPGEPGPKLEDRTRQAGPRP